MKISRTSDLLEATRLTSAGRLTEATAVLQRMLGGLMAADGTNSQDPRSPLTIDGVVETAAKGDANASGRTDAWPQRWPTVLQRPKTCTAADEIWGVGRFSRPDQLRSVPIAEGWTC
jgi:hypothetical protein